MDNYIEWQWVVNVTFDWLLILFVQRIYQLPYSMKRMVIASSSSAAISLLPLSSIVTTIVGGIVLIGVAFKPKTFTHWWRYSSLLIIFTLLIGGVAHWFEQLYVIGVALMMIYHIFERVFRIEPFLQLTMQFTYEGMTYTVYGVVDTGNELTIPMTNEAVHVIDRHLFQPKVVKRIPYRTVNQVGLIDVVKVDNVWIRFGTQLRYWPTASLALAPESLAAVDSCLFHQSLSRGWKAA